MYDGVEVHLENGLVLFQLEGFGDEFEVELTGPLDQYQLVVEVGRVELREETLGRGVELLLEVEEVGVIRDDRADADEPLDALVQDDVGHLAVEAGGG